MRRVWTKEEDDFLLNNYEKSDKKVLTNNLDRSWSAISCRASKHGIKRQLGSNYANIIYFDEWSNNMAYILGFIAADGCIIDRSKSTGDKVLSIALGEKDYSHLEKIRDELAPNKKIWKYTKKIGKNEHLIYYLRIGSRYICDKLMEIGIYHRKSKTLKLPIIPDKYTNHFVRGYFDGDGSFGVYKNQERVSIASGSKEFLEDINKIIHSECDLGIKNIVYGKSSKAYYLIYHTLDAIKFCDWMYKNSALYLDRKYEKYRRASKMRGLA